MAIARKNLETDGRLYPVLFLRFDDGERAVYPLELAKTTAEKYAYFAALGAALHRVGKAVQEAVFLSESWFLEVQKTVSALDIPPSRHPQRREAIVVMGRDAAGNAGQLGGAAVQPPGARAAGLGRAGPGHLQCGSGDRLPCGGIAG